jgi:hypothetical protein
MTWLAVSLASSCTWVARSVPDTTLGSTTTAATTSTSTTTAAVTSR